MITLYIIGFFVFIGLGIFYFAIEDPDQDGGVMLLTILFIAIFWPGCFLAMIMFYSCKNKKKKENANQDS